MNPMTEAWKVLKANPDYQVYLQGTNRAGAGGSLPQQFMRRPGDETVAGTPKSRSSNVSPVGSKRNITDYQRQMRPDVGREMSFQKLPTTGMDESAISRQPKQGMRERMRDKKRQKKIARYEKTGAGKDYRAAFPTSEAEMANVRGKGFPSQGSVFDTNPRRYDKFLAREARRPL